jgi:hypothetical protein
MVANSSSTSWRKRFKVFMRQAQAQASLDLGAHLSWLGNFFGQLALSRVVTNFIENFVALIATSPERSTI